MPFKLRLETARSKLLGSRRGSTASVTSSNGSTAGVGSEKARSISSPVSSPLHHPRNRTASSVLDKRSQVSLPLHDAAAKSATTQPDQHQSPDRSSETIADRSESLTSKDLQHHQNDNRSQLDQPTTARQPPLLELEEPTPSTTDAADASEPSRQLTLQALQTESADKAQPLPSPDVLSPKIRPLAVRRQSLLSNSNARAIKTLLDPLKLRPSTADSQDDYFSGGPPTLSANMLHRKIWVKRPGASATLVQIREDDLVDDVRDMILRKYANSLGKSYDSPDVTLRIVPRDKTQRETERTLGPEEEMCRTLDSYFPGGQTVDEALIIDVPQRRTPRPSPGGVGHGPYASYYQQDTRPLENGTDYFPPMPVGVGVPSPAALTTLSHDSRPSHPPHERAMAVLAAGQVAPLPSPGNTRRAHAHRPGIRRHPTSSPTQIVHPAQAALAGSTHLPPGRRPRLDSNASDTKHAPPNAPPLPTPPIADQPSTTQSSTPPASRVVSPAPRKPKKLKAHKSDTPEISKLPSGLLDGSVPPINVLIVEDNIINLKLLEAFMKRLKVRWQTAMNGRDAVVKWRKGGFHLVLMDIQLPIMSGLEATKEIRRLERVNNIGVFKEEEKGPGENGDVGEVKEEDKLGTESLFKSPVIIVALTASSLQSDRHEALAAGCNDFLTKPVNFVWLERKVKEWGCMQALIDFDGWRKWKTFTDGTPAEKAKGKKKTTRGPITSPQPLTLTPSPATATGPTQPPPAAAASPPVVVNGLGEDAVVDAEGDSGSG